MEDDLTLFCRQPQILFKMEDNLKCLENERRPHIFFNGDNLKQNKNNHKQSKVITMVVAPLRVT